MRERERERESETRPKRTHLLVWKKHTGKLLLCYSQTFLTIREAWLLLFPRVLDDENQLTKSTLQKREAAAPRRKSGWRNGDKN